MMSDLLIELFSEEIPARMQGKAADDLKSLITNGLVEAGLTYASAAAFATPRRLCLHIEGLTTESKPVREERKGPATTAPQPAIDGFLRATGLTLDQLEVRDDKKGQVYYAVQVKPGRAAPAIIAEVLEKTIRNFPWPKSMRWGAGSLRWVRPLHSIICILSGDNGAEVVPFEIDGITAGNTTRGHRFLSKGDITVTGFDDYEAKLKRAHVILRDDARTEHIWADAQNQAFAAGLEVVEDRGLLAEVAGLVEWPVVLMGPIGEAFLGLPPEVLQTSMKEHQKFFSVRNPKTGRIERFITVANMETADNGATILAGNLKVLSARLSDAKFFYENDLRVARAGMGEWLDGLKSVTFHNKLGSQFDRIDRIAALAREIAPAVGADPEKAKEAALIAKADLRSSMVGEFPELQGVMGRYYALAAGRDAAVADTARDHWKPKGESDDIPTEPTAVAVALAEKIDTLTGFWAIDEKPTGSKDPFALRRAALGVIRIVLGNGVRVVLGEHLWRAVVENVVVAEWTDALSDPSADEVAHLKRDGYEEFRREFWATHNQIFTRKIAADLLSFFHDRLKVFFRDEGIRHDVIDACLAPLNGAASGAATPNNDDLTLLVTRARALNATLATEDGSNLVQGFKRANNILTQAEAKDGVEYSYGADPKFAETEEERALFAALDTAEAAIAPAMEKEDFGAAMTAMAALRAPIDAFFTAVQVNSDNDIIRRNRLNLLSRIRTICLSVADLTKLEG